MAKLSVQNLRTWSAMGEILVSAVNTLSHIQTRLSIWKQDCATSFLTWWISELRRSVADTIKRGLMEMERLDAGSLNEIKTLHIVDLTILELSRERQKELGIDSSYPRD
jgi:hypothetical protein